MHPAALIRPFGGIGVASLAGTLGWNIYAPRGSA